MRKTDVEQWPKGGLEFLHQCPICESMIRSVLYNNLVDNTFFSAPGSWTLFSCGNCGCAYLDPRPSVRTIAIAYRRYFTHEDPDKSLTPTTISRIRKLALNGYLNLRWKTRRHPSSIVLGAAVSCWPVLRARLDGERMRYLPRPAANGTLLDVGCGNGAFLDMARSAGWQGIGIDFDAHAVEIGRDKGLVVYHGGIDRFDAQSERFDAITVSHVIEHVHDPKRLLAACYRLLKVGGFFFVETPNLDSYGHARFSSSWRGLEPPRHLVMFRFDGLKRLLVDAGFSDIRRAPWKPELYFTYHASKVLASGKQDRKRTAWDKTLSR